MATYLQKRLSKTTCGLVKDKVGPTAKGRRKEHREMRLRKRLEIMWWKHYMKWRRKWKKLKRRIFHKSYEKKRLYKETHIRASDSWEG